MGEMNPKRGWGGRGGLKGAPSLFFAQNATKNGRNEPKMGMGGVLKGPHPLFLCPEHPKMGRNEPKMGMEGEGGGS